MAASFSDPRLEETRHRILVRIEHLQRQALKCDDLHNADSATALRQESGDWAYLLSLIDAQQQEIERRESIYKDFEDRIALLDRMVCRAAHEPDSDNAIAVIESWCPNDQVGFPDVIRTLQEECETLRSQLSQAEADTKRLDFLIRVAEENTHDDDHREVVEIERGYEETEDDVEATYTTWTVMGKPMPYGYMMGESDVGLREAIDDAMSSEAR